MTATDSLLKRFDRSFFNMYAYRAFDEVSTGQHSGFFPIDAIATDVLRGIASDQKYIPSKYFYDDTGSRLFEKICELPEYYQTRTELKLLSKNASEIVHGFMNGNLVELGSGSSIKIRILLEAIGQSCMSGIRYIPVDVCPEALERSSDELRLAYPTLTVDPVVADFTKERHYIKADSPRLITFFGSTIGNLDEEDASSFLNNLAQKMGPDDRFLVGLDMAKPVHILEAAYNDSQGVTARFNRNILLVINRELGADFVPEMFEHVACFNEDEERIEMHLKAKKDILVRLRKVETSFHIRRGETIMTEICRKFRKPSVEEMFGKAGMRVSKWFTDQRGWFSLVEAVSCSSP